VVVSMRVMSAGRGDQYRLTPVAGDRDLGTPPACYYTLEGSPPGVWYGSGLSVSVPMAQVGSAPGMR
jgi:hypothetical protein